MNRLLIALVFLLVFIASYILHLPSVLLLFLFLAIVFFVGSWILAQGPKERILNLDKARAAKSFGIAEKDISLMVIGSVKGDVVKAWPIGSVEYPLGLLSGWKTANLIGTAKEIILDSYMWKRTLRIPVSNVKSVSYKEYDMGILSKPDLYTIEYKDDETAKTVEFLILIGAPFRTGGDVKTIKDFFQPLMTK